MSQNYLIHHGILGQKWGKMQGPPYPLGSGDHSSAEKSAAKSAGIKVGKDSGRSNYEIGYTKKGSYLTKEDGSKVSKKERKQLIKEVKKDKEVKGEYKYLEKQVKKAKQASSIGYVGTSPLMATTVNSLYKSGKNQKTLAEERVNNFLKDYNNKKVAELKVKQEKQKQREQEFNKIVNDKKFENWMVKNNLGKMSDQDDNDFVEMLYKDYKESNGGVSKYKP